MSPEVFKIQSDIASVKKVKFFPEPLGPWSGADLRFIALSRTPAEAAKPRIRGLFTFTRGMPVYSPAFAGTH